MSKAKRFRREARLHEAREVVMKAISEQIDASSFPVEVDNRNPHAVALGSMGGKKGGKARAKSLNSVKRRLIAKKAAAARWQDKCFTSR